VNYTYDGDGNRIQKSNGKIYWYGAGTEILEESDTSGNFTNEYVFFGGKRMAMRVVSSGTIYYYQDDMLGSARTMVQAGQTAVCYDADFYPFGGERDITSTCGSNYKFEGKERDTETGNDDFGARYYTSRLGRWLSADWSAVPAPVPYANLTNPQTLNLYAMVSDNPETFADLDGHCGKVTLPGALADPCPNVQTSGAATLGDGQRPGDGTQKSPTQQTQTVLDLNGIKVKVTYSFGAIFSNYQGGMEIKADPQNCANCMWAQVVTRTGTDAEGPKKDGGGIGPLYGTEGGSKNEFYDTPANGKGSSGTFKGIAVIGVADVNGKSFTAKGAMVYEYRINGHGGVKMVIKPRAATSREQLGTIRVLKNHSPDWQIH
jgi:RHS repeat-associated protein